MKKVNLIWISALFLLAFAFPSFAYTNYNMIREESLNNIANWTAQGTWTTTATGVVWSGNDDTTNLLYKHGGCDMNISCSTSNFSIEFNVNITDPTASSYQIIIFSSANKTPFTAGEHIYSFTFDGGDYDLTLRSTGTVIFQSGIGLSGEGTTKGFHVEYAQYRNNTHEVYVTNLSSGARSLKGSAQMTATAGFVNSSHSFLGTYDSGDATSRNIRYWNWTVINLSAVISVPPVDLTTPPNVTFANLTDGSPNVNMSDPFCINAGCKYPQTNDTTPTFLVGLNETGNATVINLGRSLNYSDIYRGNANSGNGTGQFLSLTLNTTNSSRIGLWNFSIGATDEAGNQMEFGTFNFTINITDGTAPNVSIYAIPNKSVFRVGVNFSLSSTILQFNYSATDNYDSILRNCSLYVNSVFRHNVSTYVNNTNVSVNLTIATIGSYNWNVTCQDNNNNIGESPFFVFDILEPPVNITLLLNGTNQSRSYEFNTTLLGRPYGIEINYSVMPNISFCLDFDYMVNWSCFSGNGSIFLNITELNQTKLRSGNSSVNMSPSINNITFQVDNQTDLIKVGFKLKGYDISGFPTELEIDLDNDSFSDIVIPGKIMATEVEVNSFRATGIVVVNASNLTYNTRSSKTININATSSLLVKNFTMRLSGYDLDNRNEFIYNERFNLSKSSFNQTLSSVNIEGVYDNFVHNDSKWNLSGTDLGNSVMQYVSSPYSHLKFTQAGAGIHSLIPDAQADLRNSSFFSVLLDIDVRCVNDGLEGERAEFWFYITDGTSNYEIVHNQSVCPGGSGISVVKKTYVNYTFIRLTDTSWELYLNKTLQSTNSLSSLDFNNKIQPKLSIEGVVQGGGTASSTLLLDKFIWSGALLNNTNGTYSSNGNFTSRILNYTNTNVSKALLECSENKPINTSIRYYLTNTANATNPLFEEVTLGQSHTFSTIGNALAWRAQLNSSDNQSSPIVRKCDISVIKSSFDNVSTDFGCDGDIDWSYTGTLNSTTSPQNVNGSIDDLSVYYSNNCAKTKTCQYPVCISLGQGGVLSVDKSNLTFNLREITANIIKLEPLTFWNWTISFLGGIANLYDIDIEFAGSKNITLFVHTYENATHDLATSNLTIQVYHSKFNASIVLGKSTYNVFPDSKDSKNVTPSGQNYQTPIWNITNLAYDEPFDVFVKLNNSMNCTLGNEGGVNVTYTNSSSKTDNINMILNTSFQSFILTNVSKQGYQKQIINQTVNIIMNETIGDNSSFLLLRNLVDEQLSAYNASEPYTRLLRNQDYRINFTDGNFTLLNSTYNMTNLFVSFNYTAITPHKGIWNFWDFTNCTKRFIIPYVVFQTYCINCVR